MPVNPPIYLYYGTAIHFLPSIYEEGIQRMNRQYVHLSQEKETAIAVGSRHGKVSVLTLLAGKMSEEGALFYCAANGVWLTDYIDPKHISK